MDAVLMIVNDGCLLMLDFFGANKMLVHNQHLHIFQ